MLKTRENQIRALINRIFNGEIKERSFKSRSTISHYHRSCIAHDWARSESRTRIAFDQSRELQNLASSTRFEIADTITEPHERARRLIETDQVKHRIQFSLPLRLIPSFPAFGASGETRKNEKGKLVI